MKVFSAVLIAFDYSKLQLWYFST